MCPSRRPVFHYHCETSTLVRSEPFCVLCRFAYTSYIQYIIYIYAYICIHKTLFNYETTRILRVCEHYRKTQKSVTLADQSQQQETSVNQYSNTSKYWQILVVSISLYALGDASQPFIIFPPPYDGESKRI